MTSLKVHCSVLFAASVLLCGFVQCANEAAVTKTPTTKPTSSTDSPTIAETTAAQLVTNSTRHARILKVLQDPNAFSAKRYHAAAQRVNTRADHAPTAGMSSYRHAPKHAVARGPLSPYHKVRPPIMRRVQNGLPINGAPTRFAFETAKGGVNQLPSKGPVPFNAGKVTVYRPPFAYAQPQLQAQTQPNVVVPQFAASSLKYQQRLPHEEFNFKASPTFNGKAIVRPLLDPHDPNYRQHLQQLQQYAGKPQKVVQQYPIPQQQQQQQQKIVQFPTLYQTQKQALNRPPTFHYETMRPREEPVLHPHVKHELPPAGGAGYAVYEHNEVTEEQPSYVHPHAHFPAPTRAEEHSQQYQSLLQEAQYTSADAAAEQQAEEYIKFMNSNDYFLPKREPNYKRLDSQHEQQTIQHKQQVEQQQTTHAYQYAHAQPQYSQHNQYSKPAITESTSTSSGSATGAAANDLNQPIKVSQLFYQEDPVPSIVRGSYHAGNNLFVVNSDGNKAVKHVVPPPSTRAPTTLAPAYSQMGYDTLRSRTPEPLRFEFTERDAVHSSYTNSPPSLGNGHEYLRFRTAGEGSTATMPDSPTSTTHIYGTGSASSSSADDQEDNEDVQIASSDFYGRVPVRQSTVGDTPQAPTSPAPAEQRDTEDYCERICANVQDDDEEIVCGSDGYMYTSEAQMECYATCLHIDVTVQSKGSCNTR